MSKKLSLLIVVYTSQHLALLHSRKKTATKVWGDRPQHVCVWQHRSQRTGTGIWLRPKKCIGHRFHSWVSKSQGWRKEARTGRCWAGQLAGMAEAMEHLVTYGGTHKREVAWRGNRLLRCSGVQGLQDSRALLQTRSKTLWMGSTQLGGVRIRR